MFGTNALFSLNTFHCGGVGPSLDAEPTVQRVGCVWVSLTSSFEIACTHMCMCAHMPVLVYLCVLSTTSNDLQKRQASPTYCH